MQIKIIIRAQRGDREAFALLFEQYKNLVYKTAYLILGESTEAEDTLQEIFLWPLDMLVPGPGMKVAHSIAGGFGL